MDGTNSLPNDLAECHELLLAAYRQSVQLEQQGEEAYRSFAEQFKRHGEDVSFLWQPDEQSFIESLEELRDHAQDSPARAWPTRAG